MFWIWGVYELFRSGVVDLLAARLPDSYDPYLIGGGMLLVIIVSYLLGSINSAVLISRHVYKDDVRTHGSGNAGTTNVLRTYGKKAAIFTFAGDGLKGLLAILFACLLFGGTVWYDVFAAYLAAFCVVLGHVFPCFAKFRGGKGVATFATCVLVLNPVIFLILFAVFAVLVIGTHFVSLGSVVSVLFYPIFLGTLDSAYSHYGINVLFSFLTAMLITWCHRSNIKRILDGNESKTYLFGKRKKNGDE